MNPVAIERRTRTLLIDSQRRVLERIARGAPLEEMDIAEGLDGNALIEELVSRESELASDRRYRTKSSELLWVRERSSLRHDTAVQPRYVLTYVIKTSAGGADPLERLSRRERQVLELVVAGRTSKEIGAGLGISPASVDTYRSRIMLKLNIQDLPGLVRFAIRLGIASV